MKLFTRSILALCACWLIAGQVRADVTVAAAANLTYALDSLNAAFAVEHRGVEVKTVTGASGTLFAQMKGGAPYDVFLSADVDYPRALAEAKLADASSLVVFAKGRLVFWYPRSQIQGSSLADVLASPDLKKIALANPQTAPYGRAAKQVLERLGVWKADSPRWVYGENISQTAQFVESGNADAGFVALALLRSPKFKGTVQHIDIPDDWHEPLDHAGVITSHGKDNPDARAFLTFLRGSAARKVWVQFGYSVPD